MKALLLYGSPRKRGNTFQIIRLVDENLRKYNIENHEIYLSELVGSMCNGCGFCKKYNKCIYNDDYTRVINRISDYDIVVLATPVYFGGVTSQTKILIDRMQLLYCSEKEIPKNKVILCVSTAAERNIIVFDGVKRTMNYVSYALGAADIEYILVNNASEIKNIDQLVDGDMVEKCVKKIVSFFI